VAAVVENGGDSVEVAIRSGDTGFAADHFRARLRYSSAPPSSARTRGANGLPPVPLEPARDLYGDLLFQGERFQRLVRYRRVAALDCEAEVTADGAVPWFSTFLPGRLLLGDPGLRDSLMHGIQVCVPYATLLPAGVDRIWIGTPDLSTVDGPLAFRAAEREHEGDSYRYDLELHAGDELVERWEGLRLEAVRKRDGAGPWVAPLLGPYLQRRMAELVDFDGAVAVEPDGDGGGRTAQRREHTALAVGRALDREVAVRYRPDGRPEVDGDWNVSASHGGGVTLAVAGTGPAGCDIESIVERDRGEWAGLLGQHLDAAEIVARETGEPMSSAATRVWAAVESLQKAGQPPAAPLTLVASFDDRWVVLAAGRWQVATFVTELRDATEPVVAAAVVPAGG
jgi:enediyne polyketide synthase